MEVMEVKESKLEAEFFQQSDNCVSSPDFKYAGPFRIGRFLGKGTSGTAFVGTHVDSGFKAALKAIKKSNLAKKPARWKQLRREIAVMKLMDHPNILKLYDVFETEDKIWMVTELARGGELFDYLQRGVPSRKTCLRFLAQITMGLLHCHHHGITHRDLKPENLLLDERLNIKIADFGMARFTTKGTFMSTTCGSPHYVSPEVIIGKYEGKTSDVWSLGVILYALTTGCLPFDHESIPELLKLIQAGVFSIPSDVDDDIADLIRRMMQVDVKDRILMEDIHTHHAFSGTWYFSKPPLTPESPDRVFNQSLDESVIEDVIALLGSDARVEVRASILSSGESLEKALYRLLTNRKSSRIASLHRLSPKTNCRSISAPSSPIHSPTPAPRDLPPSFDLGEIKRKEKEEVKPKVTSSPIAQSTSKPEFSDLLTKTFLKINMLEKKDILNGRGGSTPSPPDTTSPRGKVASTPTFTRRLSSHSKMEVTPNLSVLQGSSSGRMGEIKPMVVSPEPSNRRIFIQVEQPIGEISSPASIGPRDLKPTPNPSPFVTPDGSPNNSPAGSRAPSPSRAPSSPITRPWFAAFFKRRPSLDPYKPETPSPSNISSVRAAILHRLRAKTQQSSPRRIQIMDVDQSTRSSPRGLQGWDSSSNEMRDSSPSPVMPSPKLTARLEGLLQAAQITSVSTSFRGTTLPVVQEAGETTRGA